LFREFITVLAGRTVPQLELESTANGSLTTDSLSHVVPSFDTRIITVKILNGGRALNTMTVADIQYDVYVTKHGKKETKASLN
jgi:hypothetical protein